MLIKLVFPMKPYEVAYERIIWLVTKNIDVCKLKAVQAFTELLKLLLQASLGRLLTFFLLELLKSSSLSVRKIFLFWTIVQMPYQEEAFIESIVTFWSASWARLLTAAFVCHRSWWSALLSSCFPRHSHLLFLWLPCPSEVNQLIAGSCTPSQAWNWQLHCHVSEKLQHNVCLWALENVPEHWREDKCHWQILGLGWEITHHP